MKKGKKMPSIEIEGRSEARFELRDGKIVKVDAPAAHARGPEMDDRFPGRR